MAWKNSKFDKRYKFYRLMKVIETQAGQVQGNPFLATS